MVHQPCIAGHCLLSVRATTMAPEAQTKLQTKIVSWISAIYERTQSLPEMTSTALSHLWAVCHEFCLSWSVVYIYIIHPENVICHLCFNFSCLHSRHLSHWCWTLAAALLSTLHEILKFKIYDEWMDTNKQANMHTCTLWTMLSCWYDGFTQVRSNNFSHFSQ